MDLPVTVVPVDADNWRAVARLRVAEAQRDWVAEPAYYLALCHYSPVGWRPLAVTLPDGTVVGFLMWGFDPDDNHSWLGGIIIDEAHQRRTYGRAAVTAAMGLITAERGPTDFALSYQPSNTVARGLYASLGFVETGEVDDDEVIARRPR